MRAGRREQRGDRPVERLSHQAAAVHEEIWVEQRARTVVCRPESERAGRVPEHQRGGQERDAELAVVLSLVVATLEDQRRRRPQQDERRQVGDRTEEEPQALSQGVADAAAVPAEVEDQREQNAEPREPEADRVAARLVELGQSRQAESRQPRAGCLALPLPAGGFTGGHRRSGRRLAGQAVLRRRPLYTSTTTGSTIGRRR